MHLIYKLPMVYPYERVRLNAIFSFCGVAAAKYLIT